LLFSGLDLEDLLFQLSALGDVALLEVLDLLGLFSGLFKGFGEFGLGLE
jgi:hypothetical protein